MAQHQQQQQQSQSKALADSRSRDIRRRVEVIQKKLADLQELGVPCAFCYSSVRNTGSIFTLGDSRITEVMERHKNEILQNLIDGEHLERKLSKEIHLILPPLPAPLDELSRSALQSLIGGILKDLGLKWSDPRPNWWPLEIPFVHPRSVPENFAGSWTQALKRILESVYGYFSYDVNTYIADRLDSYQIIEGETSTELPSASDNSTRAEASSSSQSEESEPPRTANFTTKPCNHTSSNSPREIQTHTTTVTHMTRSDSSGTPEVAAASNQKRLVSSFTVENILMGRQSSSGSSNSPTSTTSSSLASPTLAPSEHSTIVGTNWVSHPPVKYTKFTMLSPNTMAEDNHKKKRSSAEGGAVDLEMVHSRIRRCSSSHDLNHSAAAEEKPSLGLKRVPSNLRSSTDSIARSIAVPTKSAVSEAAASLIALSTSQKSSQNVPTIQSIPSVVQPSKISTIPVVQTLSTSTDGKTAVLHQTFPPSQQFVLLVPSSSVAMSGHGLQAVMYAHPNQQVSSQAAQVNNHPVSSTSDITHSPPDNSNHHNTPKQSPVTTSKSQLESNYKNAPTHSRTHINSPDGQFPQPSKLLYQPIAPKAETTHTNTPPSTSSTSASSENSNDKMKLYLKRTIQKPQKLRFHMTTVVNRPKKNSATTSMKAQSPRACSNDADQISPSLENEHHHSDSERPITQPATITRSPNVYSSEYQVAEQHALASMEEKPFQRRESSPSTSLSSQSPTSEEVRQHATPPPAPAQAQTAILKDSGFHLQIVRRESEHSKSASHHNSESGNSSALLHRSKRYGDPTRGSGVRTTRSYTRRKRELTFHLYEDPSTAFKAKRTCKGKE